MHTCRVRYWLSFDFFPAKQSSPITSHQTTDTMPPRRGRAARAAAPTETEVPANVDAAQTSAEDPVEAVPTENGVATTTNDTQNSVADSTEPVPQINGKPASKSAAQKKREKRKQRRREGSVAVSEISDTESVRPPF